MAMTIPIDNRVATLTPGGRVAAWLRLFAIEMRRTPALYAGLLIVALTAWVMWERLPVGVVRWSEVSRSAGDGMIPASSIAAGIGAYVARHDERLHLDDQLAQTAFGQGRRDLLSLLATLVWCLVAYLVPIAGFFGYAAVKATWAGPQWGYVAIPAAAIALAVAGGWLVGTLWLNRFAVLVAVGAALAVHGFYPLSGRLRTEEVADPAGNTYLSITDSWYQNLFPHEMLDYSDVPSMVGWAAAWLLGISALFLCVSWWWRHRSVVALVGFAAAALVSGPAAAALVDQEPVNWAERSAAAAVDPVCETRLDGDIVVCMHPQDLALMDDVAGTVERLVVPIAGISGEPLRFVNQAQQQDPGTIYLYVYDKQDLQYQVTSTIARDVVNDSSVTLPFMTGSAQYVVLAWLLDEAEISPEEATEHQYLQPVFVIYRNDLAHAAGVTDPMEFNRFFETYAGDDRAEVQALEADLNAAIERFAALPDDERRAWLEANWDALVANQLTLEDLP